MEGRIAAWNEDTDLKNAYRNSTSWFYVEVAKQLKHKKYRKKQRYLTTAVRQKRCNCKLCTPCRSIAMHLLASGTALIRVVSVSRHLYGSSLVYQLAAFFSQDADPIALQLRNIFKAGELGAVVTTGGFRYGTCLRTQKKERGLALCFLQI